MQHNTFECALFNVRWRVFSSILILFFGVQTRRAGILCGRVQASAVHCNNNGGGEINADGRLRKKSSSKQLLGSAESSLPFWPPSHVQERKKDMRSTLRRWKEEDERAHSRRGAQESRDTWMTRQEIQSHSTPRAQLFPAPSQPNGERLKRSRGRHRLAKFPPTNRCDAVRQSTSIAKSKNNKISFKKRKYG